MIVTQVLLLVGMAFSATTVTADPVIKTCQNVKCAVRCQMVNGNPTCVDGGPPKAVAATSEELVNDNKTSVVIGEKCGITTCPTGQTCCNASCGLCVSPGMACTQQICEPAGVQCGPNVCSGDTPVCCNKSCGICTAPRGFCTQQFCERGFTPSESKRNEEADKIKLGNQKCGKATCPEGTSCCNSSCGICVKPGGACTQQFCEHGFISGESKRNEEAEEIKLGNETCGKPGGGCTKQFCPSADAQTVEDA
ncbi:hypothetical protein NEUTE2DRAFT_48410 [Neurospora tetrasperma FGSC 2509]|nr:hypothetical protein NEUTE2DRAFT_48410 [Neurospora tetrasperma FGSC 2509]